ncbi:DNA-directed RNA polymerase sigma-70 factor [Paenibacillus montaniterrae]|uniref:DNA-directed RNA polymerase sigma-70 factor n=2 Tax=Paenibacillus montaniterrae TaxID=429341 RepID=A0A919YTV5_9BACL|nr:sigma-70 family RNA polymerase sigma factor [Paenibacillus montaniterrae]GIP18299.1 DNA-directed RNA polymerase sigma-70 factor [Paenibacillus montaniterrae]
MNDTALELQLFENLKPELTSYCYRMLGSIIDADDAVQETYIRVWKSWSSFRQEASFKTWVYRIASNICLDKLRQAKRRTLPVDLSDPAVSIVEPREMLPDSSWVWPAPDFSDNPEEILMRKDTLQLCFIALLQTLPLRQRAVLILKDVFEWSSKEIAETLEMSPAAVNSALQRARETLNKAQLRSDEFNMMDVEPDQELLSRYVKAFEQFDIQALVALFHEEGSMSMPPFVMWIHGKDDLSQFFELTRWHCEGSRFIPVTVNGGYPAFAQYMPSKEPSILVPWGIHVVEIKDNKIFHVQNFINAKLFSRFGLPEQINR